MTIVKRRNQVLKGKHGGQLLVLIEDVTHLGKQGDLVEVKMGYGRNYLVPQGLATVPSEHNIKLLEFHKKRVSQAREAKVADLKMLSEQIGRVPHVTIEANANEEGHLYGSVGAAEISKALKGKNLKVETDMVKLEGKVVVVLDVLFATTTMVTALGHGAARLIPMLNEEDARQIARGLDADSFVLSGELFAELIDGFASPMPLALVQHGVKDKTVVYATTNGTVALKEAAAAEHVFAGALLNAPAVVKHIAQQHADATIVIVCSGSMGNPNLEDMYGAGYFVDLIGHIIGEQRDFSDAAIAARALFRSEEARTALLRSRVGQLMQERGHTHEVEYAAQLGVLDVVPKLLDGVLTPV